MANLGGTFLISHFKGLGTVWYIELFEHLEPEQHLDIKTKVENIIIKFQDDFSRFDSQSKLSLLNKEKNIATNRELAEMIVFAEKLHQQSGGLFDIFIRRQLEEIGYGEALSQKIDGGEEVLERVVFDKQSIKLKTKREIDLGGIGKGYLIDQIAKYLQKECRLKYFLINGGGDIYATNSPDGPIELLLEHPTNKDQYIGKVFLENQSLCASSSFKRSWEFGGKKRNHFIDTKEGRFLVGASFVIAPTAVIADTLATICILAKDRPELLFSLILEYKAEAMVLDGQEIVMATEAFKTALEAL